MSSKSIIIILSYIVSKLVRFFWDTVYISLRSYLQLIISSLFFCSVCQFVINWIFAKYSCYSGWKIDTIMLNILRECFLVHSHLHTLKLASCCLTVFLSVILEIPAVPTKHAVHATPTQLSLFTLQQSRNRPKLWFNPLTPTDCIWVQLYSILCQTGLSSHL